MFYNIINKVLLPTLGNVMLMRLNLLCNLLETAILPPPGGPIDTSRNISYRNQYKTRLTLRYLCNITLQKFIPHYNKSY